MCYYAYERKLECCKGKDGDVQHTRTVRVDKKNKVSIIVDRLLQNSARYLKHRSYVYNVGRVLPILKDGFNGKYIKLALSENLALRPKLKKLYGPFLWMGFNCLNARVTSRRQFPFYHKVPRNSWYWFYRPRKGDRLSQPWSHPACHEVQSVHFSGKQHALHCAIFRLDDTNFHYHLSDNTKHDPVLSMKYYEIWYTTTTSKRCHDSIK